MDFSHSTTSSASPCCSRQAQFGLWLYQQSMAAEAYCYGLRRRQADIGELTIDYYWYANPGKPTLVLLHGFSADKSIWLRFARQLRRHYQLLIPDLPGHGETPFAADADHSMPRQAERLALLLATLHLSQVHLIGNSMGGFLATVFASRYPEQVLSLALQDPAGLSSATPSQLEQQVRQGLNPFLQLDFADFTRFYALSMARPPYIPQLMLKGIACRYQRQRALLAAIFADFFDARLTAAELAQIKVPVLLCWGEEDQLIDISAAALWQQQLPQLQLQVFAGIGHLPMLEIPKQSAAIYREFLQHIPVK